jgi:rhamnosyltransferase
MQKSTEDDPHRACAVVVTFQPDQLILENLRRLKMQFPETVVVDNGSKAECHPLLVELEGIPSVRLIRNSRNLGIAAALNIGIRSALASNYQWVATFDQDSSVTPDFLKNMLATYEACGMKEEVAVVCPTCCGSDLEWQELGCGKSAPLFSEVTTAITSGSLIKTVDFSEMGGYDETLFIDYVDFEFCLRLRKRGRKIIKSGKSCLLHQLGTSEAHSFLGFAVSIKSHSALRYYYIMRNRLIMYRRFSVSFPLWTIHDLAWLWLDLIKILFFENDKLDKFRKIMAGFRDGLLGRLGSYSVAASKP